MIEDQSEKVMMSSQWCVRMKNYLMVPLNEIIEAEKIIETLINNSY